MYNYQNENELVTAGTTEQEIYKVQKEEHEDFYEDIVKKYKKRRGYNAIAFNQKNEQAGLIINGEQGDVVYSDIFWVSKGKSYRYSSRDFFQMIIRGKFKISILTDKEVFYWGYNKFPNEIEKLMFYARTEYMEVLVYFDIANNVFPIVEHGTVENPLDYDVFYESSEDQVEHSWIENLYNALCCIPKNEGNLSQKEF